MHTNKTTYYELPQYVGTDIINPLTDTNGAYDAIDTAMHNIASAQAEDASDITALETKVGDAVLTTTAQDVSGAVNELDAELETADTGIKARLTTVENDVETLQTKMGTATLNTTAQNVCDAINELDNDITNGSTGLNKKVADLEIAVADLESAVATAPTFAHFWKEDIVASVTSDGVKTRAQILNELFAAFATTLAGLDDNVFLHGTVEMYISNGVTAQGSIGVLNKNSNLTGYVLRLSSERYETDNNLFIHELHEIANNGSIETNYTIASDGTVTVYPNALQVIGSGITFSLTVSFYKMEKTIS